MFQAWIDDSGKDGKAQSPVYVLAGFSARQDTWKDFDDAWQSELNQPPRLRYLKASEAYNLEGEFGYDKKTRTESEWIKAHGRGNHRAVDERLLRFVKIITEHFAPTPIDSYGLTWTISHLEYEDTIRRLKSLSTATIKDIQEIEHHIRNPFYLSFQKVLSHELTLRAAQNIYLRTTEKAEILFDEDIDNKANLEKAFNEWVQVVRLDEPRWLNFLQNKTPEYRDDKCHMPLQAADLLAWHVRRMCLEISRGATSYDDPVWSALHETSGIKFWDFRYKAADWERILTRVRRNALSALGFFLPSNR